MTRKGILLSPLEIIFKTRYPLPLQQQPPVSVASDIPSCPPPPPYAQPKSSGNDQIESDSLEELVDGQEEKRWEILLAPRLNHMAGRHREKKKLSQVQVRIVRWYPSASGRRLNSHFKELVRDLKHPGSNVSRAQSMEGLSFLESLSE